MKWKLITVLGSLVLLCLRTTLLFLLKYSLVVDLQGRRFAPGAVELIQLAESTLCPDAEASNVSTRGESQEVQFVHVLQSDAFRGRTEKLINIKVSCKVWFQANQTKSSTWDISEGFGDTSVLVVDDARSSALDAPAIPHLTLTGTHALRGVDLWTKKLSFQLDSCNKQM